MQTPQQSTTSRVIDVELPTGKRGELERKIYHVEFEFNAVCDLEEQAGLGLGEMLAARKMSHQGIRALIFYGLKDRYRGTTIKLAGQIMNAWVKSGKKLDELSDVLLLALEDAGIIETRQATEDGTIAEAGSGNREADQS